MRRLIVLLVACSSGGCATMSDPNFWAAMAGGMADSAHQTAAQMQASEQRTQSLIQQSQQTIPAATDCTSTEFTPGVVQTTCNQTYGAAPVNCTTTEFTPGVVRTTCN